MTTKATTLIQWDANKLQGILQFSNTVLLIQQCMFLLPNDSAIMNLQCVHRQNQMFLFLIEMSI